MYPAPCWLWKSGRRELMSVCALAIGDSLKGYRRLVLQGPVCVCRSGAITWMLLLYVCLGSTWEGWHSRAARQTGADRSSWSPWTHGKYLFYQTLSKCHLREKWAWVSDLSLSLSPVWQGLPGIQGDIVSISNAAKIINTVGPWSFAFQTFQRTVMLSGTGEPSGPFYLYEGLLLSPNSSEKVSFCSEIW